MMFLPVPAVVGTKNENKTSLQNSVQRKVTNLNQYNTTVKHSCENKVDLVKSCIIFQVISN